MEKLDLSEKTHPNMEQGNHIILRLTYISRHSTQNSNVEVIRILAQARRNNERDGITGALVINNDYFIQSIEGSRPMINALLKKLVNDDRHFSLQVVECNEVKERLWSKWSMKHLTLSNQDEEHIRKFSVGPVFNPYLMSTSQILEFIEALSKIQERKEQRGTDTKSLGF